MATDKKRLALFRQAYLKSVKNSLYTETANIHIDVIKLQKRADMLKSGVNEQILKIGHMVDDPNEAVIMDLQQYGEALKPISELLEKTKDAANKACTEFE